MVYAVEYLKKENGITKGIGRKWFDSEKEAEKFSAEVNGRITAYTKKD